MRYQIFFHELAPLSDYPNKKLHAPKFCSSEESISNTLFTGRETFPGYPFEYVTIYALCIPKDNAGTKTSHSLELERAIQYFLVHLNPRIYQPLLRVSHGELISWYSI